MKTSTGMLLQFALGFFGAFAGSMLLGLVVLRILALAAPDWEAAWAHAGHIDRALWIGLPTATALAAVVTALWRKHRMIAIGLIAFATLDLVVSLLGG